MTGPLKLSRHRRTKKKNERVKKAYVNYRFHQEKNMQIIGIPEVEQREKETESLFKEMMA